MKNDVILEKFREMTLHSWTYEKMNAEEKLRWNDIMIHNMTKNTLKYTDKHRWDILNAIYHAYLIGLGYDGPSWRDELEEVEYECSDCGKTFSVMAEEACPFCRSGDVITHE